MNPLTPEEARLHAEAESIIAKCKLEKASNLGLEIRGLKQVPTSIRELTWLKMLHLRNCNLETLPDWLGELRELEELDLQLNPIKEWPESLFQLHQLQLLYVSDAKAEFPYDRLHAFPNLKSLLLAYMRMTEVPPSVRQLRNLRTLYLYNNQLQFLPDWLGELNHLRRLKVNGNQLESLPACLGRLGELEDLALEDNPKLGLPIEILAKDSARKILDYYFRTRASSAPQPLNEFKLILVGRGGWARPRWFTGCRPGNSRSSGARPASRSRRCL